LAKFLFQYLHLMRNEELNNLELRKTELSKKYFFDNSAFLNTRLLQDCI